MSRKAYLTRARIAEYLDAAGGNANRAYATILTEVEHSPSNRPRFADRVFNILTELVEARGDALAEIAEADAEEIATGPEIGGEIEAPDMRRERAEGHTFVFTSAQSNTKLHEPFFAALEAYCAERGAQLHVSRFTYNHSALGGRGAKVGKESRDDSVWFDPRIEPYVSDGPLEITDDLIWCGELNVLPTRINPLSSFKGYTRRASGIIPHAKMAMESIPTMKGEPPKFLYTTGAITQRNYIQKSAGQVADFHHVFGALVVEVDDRGNWWARQLNADSSGGFYDLGTYYNADGPDPIGQFSNLRCLAITHGDIHWSKVDRAVLETVFGRGGVVDQLQPWEQFFHDTIDFTARNHHNIKDPHFLHEMWLKKTDVVQEEFSEVAEFLSTMAYRPWSRHFIVVSNHDQAIETWLRNGTVMLDPVNARFWHEMNADCYIKREQGKKARPFTTALRAHLPAEFLSRCTFLQEDDSYRIGGEIEAGLHGHLGPNGARGNPKNLRTVGKANTAHTHSAGITEGIYTCGVYGKLDMGYNKGLSSWSHSLIVTYHNGKRAILTIRDGKAWRDQ